MYFTLKDNQKHSYRSVDGRARQRVLNVRTDARVHRVCARQQRQIRVQLCVLGVQRVGRTRPSRIRSVNAHLLRDLNVLERRYLS